MKKKKEFALRTLTDIKVFMLFLLDHIGYPIDHTSFIDIVSESTSEISLDYDEALRELADSGHIISDTVGGESYYMVSEMGKMVAAELYNTLDRNFLEKSLKAAGKYISFAKGGIRSRASISERADKRFVVTLSVENSEGPLMSASLTVKSLPEAELIKNNFEARPESIYRGLLFSATGRMEYFS